MLDIIKKEIKNYKEQTVELFEGHSFSTHKLIRRINLYKNEVYPKGKLDSQGNYKYWFNVIAPRVSAEIKNIDFDTKDIMLYSDSMQDSIRVLLANVALDDWLKETGQAEKLNEAIEQGSEWGNVVWKKSKDGYEILDLTNVMVLNQTAKTIHESDVIEYACMLSSDLRKKDEWYDVEELIKSAKPDDKKTSPEFYIYERNGEICEKDYFKAMGIEKEGKEDVYFLAKVIVGG